MTQDPKRIEEFSAVAQQAMQQAQGATQQYFSWLQKGITASPWSNTELNKKMMGFAEQNIAATFAYVQKLSQARDFQDLMRIQTEYVQAQMESFGTQARDIINASTNSATRGAATKSESGST